MEPSLGRCKDHQFQESEQIRSLVFLWVCKRASQSTVVFCLWDSRAVSQHYKQRDWGSRSTFVPGEHSLKENPLVDMNKVLLLPPLHIKLGLMKNFVKALHKNGAAFQHLSTVSQVLVLLSIFVGPQIREVLKDTDFVELLNLKELRA